MNKCANCGAKIKPKDDFCSMCGEKIEKEEKKNYFSSEEDMISFLNTCYERCKNGIPGVSVAVSKMADDYLKKYSDPQVATKKMLNNQIAKCTTSGFITGFGGVITMPVTIPANIGSVLYVQMRMIACTAYMAGMDLESDQVQTFVYACLAGVSVNGVIKKAGINIGVKLANNAIAKIPGKALVKINQKVGFRLITKFGEKGAINLGKMIPGVGAVIGGTFDFAETKIIANRSYKFFFEGNFGDDQNGDGYMDDEIDPNIIDAEVVEDIVVEQEG